MSFRNLLIAQQQKERTFTVIFDSAGGNPVALQTVKRGERVTELTPERTGYRFTGWTLNGTAFDFSSPINGNITLVAGWEIKTFTVTFDAAGGSEVPAQTVAYGSRATNVTPEKDSYTFTGWTLNGTLFDFDTVITENISLVAGWQYVAQLRTQSGQIEAEVRPLSAIPPHYGIGCIGFTVTFPVAFNSLPTAFQVTFSFNGNSRDISQMCTVSNAGITCPEFGIYTAPIPLQGKGIAVWSATGYY